MKPSTVGGTNMPSTFVYRTADIYLCAIKATRERSYISCSVHKSKWHSTYAYDEIYM